MASILKKPWKETRKRMAISPLSHERRKEIRDAKKQESAERKMVINEVRRNKRAFCDAVRQREEEKQSKRRKMKNLR